MCSTHVEDLWKKLRIMSVTNSKIRNKINEFADSDLNIAEFYNAFQNYFIDVFNILNALSLVLDNSELSNIKIINDSNIHITDTINLNLSNTAEDLIIITSSDLLRKTLIEKMIA